MISSLLSQIAAGSSTATPTTGSAGLDAVDGLPADIIRMVAGLFGAVGS